MKTWVFILVTLFLINAFADAEASDLLQASVQCDSPNNPLRNGLMALRGNSWGVVVVTPLKDSSNLRDGKSIVAEVWYDPTLKNSAVNSLPKRMGAVILRVGKKPIKKGSTTGRLNCELRVANFQLRPRSNKKNTYVLSSTVSVSEKN